MVRQARKFTRGSWNHILWQTFYTFFAVTVLFFFVINVFLIGKIFSDQKEVFKSDFPQYYSAALMVKEGKGNQLYNIDTQGEYQYRVFGLQTRTSVVPFRNPPFAVLLYIPLVAYTLFQSFGIFASFNFILLFLIIYLSLKTFNNVGKIAFLPILPLAFYPNTLSIVRGQVSILMLVFFLVFYGLLKSKPFLAGVVYSLLLIKLQFAIVGFPFFLIITRQKKGFILGTVISSLALFLISLYISGPNTLLAYPSFLLSTESAFFGSPVETMFSLHNFFSFVSASSNSNPIYIYLSQAVLYIFTIFFFLRKSREANYDTLFVSATLLLTVFSVHVLPYDLSLFFVAILILLNRAFSDKSKNSWLVLALAGLMFVLPNLVIADIYSFSPLFLFLIGFFILLTNPLSTQSKITT
ncbi:DUF2029 domain-containing protein [Patescibacteria group bacterium]|nr:DUF2029 domain-containing protein [Patescibacteria group bacterium]